MEAILEDTLEPGDAIVGWVVWKDGGDEMTVLCGQDGQSRLFTAYSVAKRRQGCLDVVAPVTQQWYDELCGKIGRIDIPGEDGKAITQYFGGHTIYRLTPVSEDVARAFAKRNRPRPVYVYELALPAPSEPDDEWDDDVSDGMDF